MPGEGGEMEQETDKKTPGIRQPMGTFEIRDTPEWKVGDRVCFADLKRGGTFLIKTVYHGQEPNIELEELPGVFASDMFVAAPISLPPVELQAREVEQSGTESADLVKALWAITAELREIRRAITISSAVRSGDGYPGT